jgi:carboxylate-amine ligase
MTCPGTGAGRLVRVLTVGVEEEFLLLDDDGAVAPVAGDVLRLAGPGARLTREFLAYQVEIATAVCTGLDGLYADLARLRHEAALAAERAGARLVAVGVPPFARGPLDAVTDEPRYVELARRFPDAVMASGTCGCHVHIGIADRDLAVDVLGRLRPWLPALLALAANSPIANGADSGWNSVRYRAQRWWPTFGPPALWRGADRYDEAVREFVGSGAAMDAASVYLIARLSARYPTVEVRVADTFLTVEDTTLFAGVVRALVESLISDARDGRHAARPPAARVEARLAAAAHHGLGPGRELVGLLLDRVAPTLAAELDSPPLRRLTYLGTGAQRQRELFARSGGPAAFVSALAAQTLPG